MGRPKAINQGAASTQAQAGVCEGPPQGALQSLPGTDTKGFQELPTGYLSQETFAAATLPPKDMTALFRGKDGKDDDDDVASLLSSAVIAGLGQIRLVSELRTTGDGTSSGKGFIAHIMLPDLSIVDVNLVLDRDAIRVNNDGIATRTFPDRTTRQVRVENATGYNRRIVLQLENGELMIDMSSHHFKSGDAGIGFLTLLPEQPPHKDGLFTKSPTPVPPPRILYETMLAASGSSKEAGSIQHIGLLLSNGDLVKFRVRTDHHGNGEFSVRKEALLHRFTAGSPDDPLNWEKLQATGSSRGGKKTIRIVGGGLKITLPATPPSESRGGTIILDIPSSTVKLEQAKAGPETAAAEKPFFDRSSGALLLPDPETLRQMENRTWEARAVELRFYGQIGGRFLPERLPLVIPGKLQNGVFTPESPVFTQMLFFKGATEPVEVWIQNTFAGLVIQIRDEGPQSPAWEIPAVKVDAQLGFGNDAAEVREAVSGLYTIANVQSNGISPEIGWDRARGDIVAELRRIFSSAALDFSRGDSIQVSPNGRQLNDGTKLILIKVQLNDGTKLILERSKTGGVVEFDLKSGLPTNGHVEIRGTGSGVDSAITDIVYRTRAKTELVRPWPSGLPLLFAEMDRGEMIYRNPSTPSIDIVTKPNGRAVSFKWRLRRPDPARLQGSLIPAVQASTNSIAFAMEDGGRIVIYFQNNEPPIDHCVALFLASEDANALRARLVDAQGNERHVQIRPTADGWRVEEKGRSPKIIILEMEGVPIPTISLTEPMRTVVLPQASDRDIMQQLEVLKQQLDEEMARKEAAGEIPPVKPNPFEGWTLERIESFLQEEAQKLQAVKTTSPPPASPPAPPVPVTAVPETHPPAPTPLAEGLLPALTAGPLAPPKATAGALPTGMVWVDNPALPDAALGMLSDGIPWGEGTFILPTMETRLNMRDSFAAEPGQRPQEGERARFEFLGEPQSPDGTSSAQVINERLAKDRLRSTSFYNWRLTIDMVFQSGQWVPDPLGAALIERRFPSFNKDNIIIGNHLLGKGFPPRVAHHRGSWGLDLGEGHVIVPFRAETSFADGSRALSPDFGMSMGEPTDNALTQLQTLEKFTQAAESPPARPLSNEISTDAFVRGRSQGRVNVQFSKPIHSNVVKVAGRNMVVDVSAGSSESIPSAKFVLLRFYDGAGFNWQMVFQSIGDGYAMVSSEVSGHRLPQRDIKFERPEEGPRKASGVLPLGAKLPGKEATGLPFSIRWEGEDGQFTVTGIEVGGTKLPTDDLYIAEPYSRERKDEPPPAPAPVEEKPAKKPGFGYGREEIRKSARDELARRTGLPPEVFWDVARSEFPRGTTLALSEVKKGPHRRCQRGNLTVDFNLAPSAISNIEVRYDGRVIPHEVFSHEGRAYLILRGPLNGVVFYFHAPNSRERVPVELSHPYIRETRERAMGREPMERQKFRDGTLFPPIGRSLAQAAGLAPAETPAPPKAAPVPTEPRPTKPSEEAPPAAPVEAPPQKVEPAPPRPSWTPASRPGRKPAWEGVVVTHKPTFVPSPVPPTPPAVVAEAPAAIPEPAPETPAVPPAAQAPPAPERAPEPPPLPEPTIPPPTPAEPGPEALVGVRMPVLALPELRTFLMTRFGYSASEVVVLMRSPDTIKNLLVRIKNIEIYNKSFTAARLALEPQPSTEIATPALSPEMRLFQEILNNLTIVANSQTTFTEGGLLGTLWNMLGGEVPPAWVHLPRDLRQRLDEIVKNFRERFSVEIVPETIEQPRAAPTSRATRIDAPPFEDWLVSIGFSREEITVLHTNQRSMARILEKIRVQNGTGGRSAFNIAMFTAIRSLDTLLSGTRFDTIKDMDVIEVVFEMIRNPSSPDLSQSPDSFFTREFRKIAKEARTLFFHLAQTPRELANSKLVTLTQWLESVGISEGEQTRLRDNPRALRDLRTKLAEISSGRTMSPFGLGILEALAFLDNLTTERPPSQMDMLTDLWATIINPYAMAGRERNHAYATEIGRIAERVRGKMTEGLRPPAPPSVAESKAASPRAPAAAPEPPPSPPVARETPAKPADTIPALLKKWLLSIGFTEEEIRALGRNPRILAEIRIKASASQKADDKTLARTISELAGKIFGTSGAPPKQYKTLNLSPMEVLGHLFETINDSSFRIPVKKASYYVEFIRSLAASYNRQRSVRHPKPQRGYLVSPPVVLAAKIVALFNKRRGGTPRENAICVQQELATRLGSLTEENARALAVEIGSEIAKGKAPNSAFAFGIGFALGFGRAGLQFLLASQGAEFIERCLKGESSGNILANFVQSLGEKANTHAWMFLGGGATSSAIQRAMKAFPVLRTTGIGPLMMPVVGLFTGAVLNEFHDTGRVNWGEQLKTASKFSALHPLLAGAVQLAFGINPEGMLLSLTLMTLEMAGITHFAETERNEDAAEPYFQVAMKFSKLWDLHNADSKKFDELKKVTDPLIAAMHFYAASHGIGGDLAAITEAHQKGGKAKIEAAGVPVGETFLGAAATLVNLGGHGFDALKYHFGDGEAGIAAMHSQLERHARNYERMGLPLTARNFRTRAQDQDLSMHIALGQKRLAAIAGLKIALARRFKLGEISEERMNYELILCEEQEAIAKFEIDCLKELIETDHTHRADLKAQQDMTRKIMQMAFAFQRSQFLAGLADKYKSWLNGLDLRMLVSPTRTRWFANDQNDSSVRESLLRNAPNKDPLMVLVAAKYIEDLVNRSAPPQSAEASPLLAQVIGM